MIVVADAELPPDEVANHRPGPKAGRESGGLRSGLDEDTQLLALLVAQPGPRSRSFSRPQALGAHRLVPLKPAIDGSPRDVQLGGKGDDCLARQIARNSFRPAPDVEVASFLGFPIELAKSGYFLRSPALPTDCFPVFRASQSDLPEKRDRPTLILPKSFVNQSVDLPLADPV